MAAALGAVAPRLQPAALLFAGVAALTGLAAGVSPPAALGLALAIAFVFICLNELAVGVVIFAALSFLELAPIGGGGLSLAKAAGAVLALSWVAVVTIRSRDEPLFFTSHPALTGLLALFAAWSLLSITWAESGADALEATYRYALNIMLLPIVYTAVRERRHAVWLCWAFVGGAVVAAVYGIVSVPDASAAASSATPAGSLNRISGTVGDPNVLAAVLVAGAALALVLVVDSTRRAPSRLLAATALGLCLLGVVSTLSRGGLVALGVAVLAAVVLAGRRRAGFVVGAATAIAAVALYFALIAPQAAVDRLAVADGGSGRTDIWKVGWRMVESSPLHGVGSGNFSTSSIHYLLVEPGSIERDEFIVDTPLVAHNIYLELLAEVGVVGLALFLMLVAAALASAVRAAGQFAENGDERLELIARGTAIAVLGLLAADFFISDQFNKQLWLLLALGPALLRISKANALKAEG